MTTPKKPKPQRAWAVVDASGNASRYHGWLRIFSTKQLASKMVRPLESRSVVEVRIVPVTKRRGRKVAK